jgi:DNA-binding CsgD family transcriptional regulator
MAQCITCGSELHPERAKKYDYCMAPACQEKNLKGLAMVAVGVNKAADQYLLLDEQTRDELASGKFRDQRRGSFGTSLPSSGLPSSGLPSSGLPSSGLPSSGPAAGADLAGVTAGRSDGAQSAHRRPSSRRPASRPAPRRPWSKSQEKLALLYNEQGKRPQEIADKLGLSPYIVSQIILTSRNRGKL